VSEFTAETLTAYEPATRKNGGFASVVAGGVHNLSFRVRDSRLSRLSHLRRPSASARQGGERRRRGPVHRRRNSARTGAVFHLWTHAIRVDLRARSLSWTGFHGGVSAPRGHRDGERLWRRPRGAGESARRIAPKPLRPEYGRIAGERRAATGIQNVAFTLRKGSS